MIRGIRIVNFQSHKETVVKFSKYFNLIVGENDSGKTAIIRALRWVLFNDLKGDYFRSYWGGDTQVTILTDDGHKISRVRTDKENYYIVDGEKIFGFGAKVPEEVQQITKIDTINFQEQFDNVFLFSASNAEVTRMFNDLFDLDSIDKVASALNKRKRDAMAKVNVLEKQKAEVESELERLLWTKDVEVKIDEIESLEGNINFLGMKVTQVNDLLGEIEDLQADVNYLKPEWALKQAEKLENEIKKMGEKIGKVFGLFREFENIQDFDFEVVERKVVRAEKLKNKMDELADKILKVKTANTGLRGVEIELKTQETGLKKLEDELHELVGETCPFCGRVIDETVING